MPSEKRSLQRLVTCPFMVLFALFGAPAICADFFESWEGLPLGSVRLDANSLFTADAGTWLYGDTVSEFPECGSTPHRLDVVASEGGRALRLTSNNSNSDCADNLWVTILRFAPVDLNPAFPLYIDSGTILSFQETGSLVDPQPIGRPRCVAPPCGDNISLLLHDSRGYLLVYVLQRAEASTQPHTISGKYAEIFLDPTAGLYNRNVLGDFSKIDGYQASGARIDSIEFRVDEHGVGTIDDIVVSNTSGLCSDDASSWIAKSYIGYYNRCPDRDGFAYWCRRLDREGGGSNLSVIIAAFGTSREYTERFGALSDRELLNNLYRNMFDRDAEPGGLTFYLGLLETRRQDWRDSHAGSNDGATEYALSRIALDVLNGAQGEDANLLNRKIDACAPY